MEGMTWVMEGPSSPPPNRERCPESPSGAPARASWPPSSASANLIRHRPRGGGSRGSYVGCTRRSGPLTIPGRAPKRGRGLVAERASLGVE
jgi:hypothetical protein